MIPTPHAVSVRRWVPGGTPNPHGYSEGSHGPAEPLPVHALAPGASEEARQSGRDVSEVAWTVYAPAGTVIGSEDLVTVGADEFEVVGDSLDWTRGPWPNAAAGVVFELKRQEG